MFILFAFVQGADRFESSTRFCGVDRMNECKSLGWVLPTTTYCGPPNDAQGERKGKCRICQKYNLRLWAMKSNDQMQTKVSEMCITKSVYISPPRVSVSVWLFVHMQSLANANRTDQKVMGLIRNGKQMNSRRT